MCSIPLNVLDVQVGTVFPWKVYSFDYNRFSTYSVLASYHLPYHLQKKPEWTVFELNEDGIYWTERLNRKGKIVYWEDIHQVAFCRKEGVPATKKKKAIPGRAVYEVRLHDGRSIEIDLRDYIGWYSFRQFKKAMVLFSGRNDIFVNEHKFPYLIFFWYCDLFYTNNYRYPKE